MGMKALLGVGSGSIGYQNKLRTNTKPREISREDRRMFAQKELGMFLKREMPVRFAHRARDLSMLPYGLSDMPSIQSVKTWYEQSFEEVLSVPDDDDMGLKTSLSAIYNRHQDTLVMIAKGLYEFQRSAEGKRVLEGGRDLSDLVDIHNYFDRFFLSRIGIRILIGHYLELQREQEADYVGLVCRKTSAAKVAKAAAEDARYMCDRHFGDAPKVEFLGRTDLTFPYVPSHLYYILFELLKNSMRAVVEHRGINDMPDIRIVIADGEDNEDIVIRISDFGGGIPRSISSKVFSYLFTTAHDAFPEHLENLEDFGRENPLAGLGYGLPISRGYVRYFGGELTLMSMEGYGTDAFVHLPRLAGDREPLV